MLKSKEIFDSSNRKYWNIVKGISILSIVIGHCCYFLVPFVYLYHLAIFFFVSGYFYSEEKYGDNPNLLIINRAQKNWPKYAFFCIVFILLHNLMVNKGLLLNTVAYSRTEMIINIINSMFFITTEDMCGALWFIPVLLIANAFFGYIIYFSKKLCSEFSISEEYKDAFIIFMCILCGIVGLFLNNSNIYVLFHSETSFLVIPLIAVGYYTKEKIADLSKILKFALFIPVVLLLYYFAYKMNLFINLSSNVIGSLYLFYPISFIGIYFVLFLSKIVYFVPYLSRIIKDAGEYSFEIMASHFFVIKCVDFMYAKFNGIVDGNIYGIYPYAFKQLWPYYVILSIIIPILLMKIIHSIKFDLSSFFDFLKKKKELILFVLLVVLTSIPILKLGIMHNDELMSRYWSSQGFLTFYKHYFIEQIQKGRALSCIIIPFTMYLGFIGQNSFSFKFFQILSIIACCLLFEKLISHATNSKKLSKMFTVVFLLFLQISFEPTVPNVFVTFYNISLCLLFISFTKYIDYLKFGKKKSLYSSMIMFFIVELSYESFVTYVPVFMLLFIGYLGIKKVKKDKIGFSLPIITGVLYLILYILSSKLFPSNYSGNQIAGINIINSLKIIESLSFYSFPVSYIFSSKYRYLFNVYFDLSVLDIIRIVLTVLCAILLIILYLRKDEKKLTNSSVIKSVVICFFGVVLPIIPISVASMYQNANIGSITLGLPVSFFAYFCSSLLFTLIMYKLLTSNDCLKTIGISLIIVAGFITQTMNSVFSRRANQDFQRIQNIENFVSSEVFDEYSGKTIYTTDLFQLNDALYIHDTYWTEYANLHDNNVTFINKSINNNLEMNLLYIDNKYFIIEKQNGSKELYSKTNLDNQDITVNDNAMHLEKGKIIGGYYKYSF